MPAQWTCEVVGEMHKKRITAKALAGEVGWHPKYLSRVLNGHETPKGAEEKVRSALKKIAEGRSGTSSTA